MATMSPLEAVSSKFVDNTISSIINLYVALFSLTCLFLYVANGKIDHHRAMVALAALDKLNLMREVAYDKVKPHRPLLYSELPDFLDKAADEFNELFEPSGRIKADAGTARQFPPLPVPSAEIIKDFPMRQGVRSACDIAIFNMKPGVNFQFGTLLVVGRVFNVQSENVSIVMPARQCAIGPPREFAGFIFKEGSHIAVALPTIWQKDFPGLIPEPLKPALR